MDEFEHIKERKERLKDDYSNIISTDTLVPRGKNSMMFGDNLGGKLGLGLK